MRLRTGRGKALVAGGTAVLLVMLSASAIVVTRDDRESAPGLASDFRRIDASYQQVTREFVARAGSLESADLRTALQLYDLVLDAAQAARRQLGELGSVPETRRPVERMSRALQVQELALEESISAARNRDSVGTEQAARQFQAGVLAYMAARAQMNDALRECAERCR